MDCAALFSNPDFDASTKFGRPLLKVISHKWFFPRKTVTDTKGFFFISQLPKFLAKDYTYQGRIPIVTELYDDSKFDGREQAKKRTLKTTSSSP